MKNLIFLITLVSCTQKYQTYHIIDKHDFAKNNYHSPITSKLFPGRKSRASHCEGQVFWASNAQKKTDQHLSRMIQTLCPGKGHLLNSKLTETWWTTIFYSRSCIEFEYYCPR